MRRSFIRRPAATPKTAKTLFVTALPYLRSVKSDETDAPRYASAQTMTNSEFCARVQSAFGVRLSDPARETAVLSRYASGRVESLRLGGTTVTGKEFRSAFSLDSTNFSFEFGNGAVTISTKGFGHGVGLSQTGAQMMAEEGSDYREILSYYLHGHLAGKILVAAPRFFKRDPAGLPQNSRQPISRVFHRLLGRPALHKPSGKARPGPPHNRVKRNCAVAPGSKQCTATFLSEKLCEAAVILNRRSRASVLQQAHFLPKTFAAVARPAKRLPRQELLPKGRKKRSS